MTKKRYPIKGYEDLYEIDIDGNIFSLGRWKKSRWGTMFWYEGRKLKPSKGVRGYLVVGLFDKDGKVTSLKHHRLIAQAFIPNPDNKPYINHIDGNKHNNCVSNLEWATPQENSDHAVLHGLTPSGERNGAAKLSDKEVAEIYHLVMAGAAVNRLAKTYSVDRNTLTRAVYKRLSETHKISWKEEMLRRKSKRFQRRLI